MIRLYKSLYLYFKVKIYLCKRKSIKKGFFQGEDTFDSAFWQWKSEEMLNGDVLDTLRIAILAQNQDGYTNDFETISICRFNKSSGIDYQKEYEKSWQLQNELDALNLKAISLLSAAIDKYPKLYSDLKSSEKQWLRKSTMFVSDESQQSKVSDMVLERQKY